MHRTGRNKGPLLKVSKLPLKEFLNVPADGQLTYVISCGHFREIILAFYTVVILPGWLLIQVLTLIEYRI